MPRSSVAQLTQTWPQTFGINEIGVPIATYTPWQEGGRPERSDLLFNFSCFGFGRTCDKKIQKALFYYGARSPHRTTKPSLGWIWVGGSKPQLVLFELDPART